MSDPHSGKRRQAFHLPGGGHPLARGLIRHPLVAGKHVRQPAHVAGALNVVLAAQRVYPAARHSNVPAKHGKVRQRFDVIGAGGVLGDPHAIQNACTLRPCVCSGGIDQVRGKNSGDFLDVFGGVFLNRFAERLEAHRAAFHKLSVIHVLGDDHVHQAVDPGDVGPEIGPQPLVGVTRHYDAPRVDDDELFPFQVHGALDEA